MNERLKYPLFGGIGFGLSFAIIALIIGGIATYSSSGFPFALGANSTTFLLIIYEILVILVGILTGNFLSFNSQRPKEIVQASTKTFFIMLGVLVPILLFVDTLSHIIGGMYEIYDAYDLAQVPQAEIDRQLVVAQFYCGPVSGIIFGAIFGGVFGLAMPSKQRTKPWLLGALLGAVGFGLGGYFSGWVIPTIRCFEIRESTSFWRLVLDAGLVGFFGGAGLGLMQYIITLQRSIDGDVSNE